MTLLKGCVLFLPILRDNWVLVPLGKFNVSDNCNSRWSAIIHFHSIPRDMIHFVQIRNWSCGQLLHFNFGLTASLDLGYACAFSYAWTLSNLLLASWKHKSVAFFAVRGSAGCFSESKLCGKVFEMKKRSPKFNSACHAVSLRWIWTKVKCCPV